MTIQENSDCYRIIKRFIEEDGKDKLNPKEFWKLTDDQKRELAETAWEMLRREGK
jgi:pyoverdine/dityrosine biosynthesis protein Dit1